MTAEEEANVTTLRNGFAEWDTTRGASVDNWMNLVADEVRWRTLGAAAAGDNFTQGCSSKAEVKRYFEELGTQWAMLGYTMEEFIAQGDRVVAVGNVSWRHRATGNAVHTPLVNVIRMRDGKIVDFMEFYDTAAAMAGTRPS
jgi:ketosteroid isomerase-like protein